MTLNTDTNASPTVRLSSYALMNPVSRLVFGDGTQPRWVRPAVLALLAATAVLYLRGLGESGWANEYYAAAVQAGTQDWKAWLFGSLDAGNAITVDKPPVALWAMVLSGRLFGFTPFTMLLPQALMGVATVAIVYAAVRRVSGPGAGLIAGTALALTPVAALMFRYNNPDALLVLLLTVAAYLMVRAIETGGTRWIVLAGVVVGLAFLTKMLQAVLVVPGFALAFLVAAPTGWWQRVGRLLLAAGATLITAGSFLALVSLWPADSRPYIGGSTDNSLLQLALGYNGIQRVMGRDGGSGPSGPRGGIPGGGNPGGGGPGGVGHLFFGGEPGISRLFGASMGTEVSWLLPSVIIGLLATVWLTRRAARTCGLRANLLMWGGWLVVTGAVFSLMGGIIHPYYTVALVPAISALVGICLVELWRDRQNPVSRLALFAMPAATGVWAFILLARTPDWLPWLRWVVLLGLLSVVIVALASIVGPHRLGRATAVVAAAGALFGIAAPAAYTIETTMRAYDGPMAMSGPVRTDSVEGGRGPDGRGDEAATAANPMLQRLIESADSRWAAASIGSMTAGSLELETGSSVMAIGGFTGGDTSPTLDQFQAYVADGQIKYFVGGGFGGPGGLSESTNQIESWVEQTFIPVDVGGTTVYDLQR